jgi:hypothetical protein
MKTQAASRTGSLFLPSLRGRVREGGSLSLRFPPSPPISPASGEIQKDGAAE